MSTSRTLAISSLTSQHAGSYTCLARIVSQMINVHSQTVTLTIGGKNAKFNNSAITPMCFV